MEPERNEVFERIPWETLEEKKHDRPWLAYGVAGAIVLGALAYSFMSNLAPAMPQVATTVPAPEVTAAPAPPSATAPLPPTATTAPVVTAEADLYAVHPERVIDRLAAHAEWFVAEYLTFDGSEESRLSLTELMPAGLPLPAATEGTRVFVEWVRALGVEELADSYRVTVLARTLAAEAGGAYQRQPPTRLAVELIAVGDGAQVIAPPQVVTAPETAPYELALEEVPEQVASAALETSGGSEVVGGLELPDGGWRVVVVVPMPDGASRPLSVMVGPEPG